MNKCLTLSMSVVLTVLALAALPTGASAGEFVSDCSSGATCSATISGGATTLLDDSGGAAGKVSCSSVTGTESITSGSSTGTIHTILNGCTDEALGTSCSNTGTAGSITMHATWHNVKIRFVPLLTGRKYTSYNWTYTCAGGLVTRTVTGNLIGNITNPSCGVAKASHSIEYSQTGGSQTYKQVTETGTIFDLTSGSHAGDSTTTAWTGAITSTYNEGKTVKYTC